ncbi:adenylyl-sulfate kinase [Calditrichota bacterium]
MSSNLIEPYTGKFAEIMSDTSGSGEFQDAAGEMKSIGLQPQQVILLEMLMNGSLSPLDGFMTKADYKSVMNSCILENGTFFPMPILLRMPKSQVEDVVTGTSLALRDGEGVLLAVLDVEDVWEGDAALESNAPGFADIQPEDGNCLSIAKGELFLGGKILGWQLPIHYDFRPLRLTPLELRAKFEKLGWRRVIAWQSELPIHKAQMAQLRMAAGEQKASLLMQTTIDDFDPYDREYFRRVRALEAVQHRFPNNTARLALQSLPKMKIGARSIWLRAIVAQNCGCSHLMIDNRYSATVSLDIPGVDTSTFDLPKTEIVTPSNLVFDPEQDKFVAPNEISQYSRPMMVEEDELLERLEEGREIPVWFTYPEVVKELNFAHPPRYRQGFTVFFTGLSGAGKSTIANVLHVKLMEMGNRPVTMLDGDIVRRHLSAKLGFSKEDRDINIKRIGFVASEITKNGGIALCAPIAPYDATRKEVRKMIATKGGFILVHVSTDLEVCEQRDRKGLYAKARAGIIKEFTGISDPYEEPTDADIILDTTQMRPEEAAQEIVLHLERQGYIDILRNGHKL